MPYDPLTPTDFFTEVEPGFEPTPPIEGGIIVGELDASAFQSRQIGYQFTANAAIEVTKLRLFADHTTTETVTLWDVATQTLLASADITGAGVLDWYEAAIDPVALEAGKSYIVSSYAGGASRKVQVGVGDNLLNLSYHPDITVVYYHRQTAGSGFPSGSLLGGPYIIGDFGIEPLSSGPQERTFDALVPTDFFGG